MFVLCFAASESLAKFFATAKEGDVRCMKIVIKDGIPFKFYSICLYISAYICNV